MKTPRLLPLAGALVVALAACSPGGAASPSAPPPSSSAPSEVPSASVPPDAGVVGGGGQPGLPGGGHAKLVAVFPAAQNPHDVSVTTVVPAINGRKLALQLEWWSGVEPCNVLAGVVIDRQGSTINLTVREGTGDPNAMCIEIAQLKAFIVDIGELEPGTYTIVAKGEAAPLDVTIT